MEEKTCYRKNTKTSIILKVRSKLEKSDSSKEYEINKKIIFSIIVTPKKNDDDSRFHDIYIFFHRIVLDPNLTHKLIISSSALGLFQKKMFLNDVDENSKRWICRRFHKEKSAKRVYARGLKDDQWYMLDITLSIETSGNKYLFKVLYTDEVMVDFELFGENGSVKVHRAILAEASPVLHTMLTGEWRESKEGRITISGISKRTLQDFKNYLYLNVLPDKHLEPLMLLSSLYMMPELEHKCGEKMLEDLRATNAWKILHFALNNDLKWLGLNVLKCIGKGFVDVDEISESVLPSTSPTTPQESMEQCMQYTVDQITTITKPAYGPPVNCNGLVWNFFVKVNFTGNRKELGIYISCNGVKDAAYWLCACEYEMKLLNYLGEQYNFSGKGDHVFHKRGPDCGFFPNIPWCDLVDPDRGYLKPETRSIDIDVRVNIAVPHIIYNEVSDATSVE